MKYLIWKLYNYNSWWYKILIIYVKNTIYQFRIRLLLLLHPIGSMPLSMQESLYCLKRLSIIIITMDFIAARLGPNRIPLGNMLWDVDSTKTWTCLHIIWCGHAVTKFFWENENQIIIESLGLLYFLWMLQNHWKISKARVRTIKVETNTERLYIFGG